VSIEKIEKTFDKPIYLVKFFNIVMVADYLTGVLYKENLLDLFTENVLPIDRLFSIIFASLITCFIIKIVLGVCGKKIFLRFGNYFVYNKDGISKSIESWQKDAYNVSNQYAIFILNKYKQYILVEENGFVDIFINIILFVIYLAYSIKTKLTLLIFLTSNTFLLWLIIIYFIILGIIVYSFFDKKNKMFIEM
jgi:hypothetical protein